MLGNWALIDIDTPKDAYTKSSWNGGPDMELVFSDEFNVPGRTFWPGDDPYWEAADLHYWVGAVSYHRRLSPDNLRLRKRIIWNGTVLTPSPLKTGVWL
jgi:hypothetical protein